MWLLFMTAIFWNPVTNLKSQRQDEPRWLAIPRELQHQHHWLEWDGTIWVALFALFWCLQMSSLKHLLSCLPLHLSTLASLWMAWSLFPAQQIWHQRFGLVYTTYLVMFSIAVNSIFREIGLEASSLVSLGVQFSCSFTLCTYYNWFLRSGCEVIPTCRQWMDTHQYPQDLNWG